MKAMLKKSIRRFVLSSALVIAGALVATVSLPSEGNAGISTTKHNLGSGGTGVNKFSGTAEICVFCHTPHGSDTSASVPLWNKTMANPNTYTTYDNLGTSTLDSDILPVGSVSLACLSCHDGATAMDSVINEPGSGSTVTTYSTDGVWSGVNQTAGKINTIANLGKDLQNDHPIGVQFSGIAAGSSTDSTAIDADFKSATQIGADLRWYVETGAVGGRDKTDFMLYTRDNSGNGGGNEPFVECATCHDPHSNNTTFLRIANTGSAVCLACHTK